MRTIAICCQKGGTGKTTVALAIAVAAGREGQTAAVIDLDPQATASSWSDRREDQNPVVVSAQPARLKQILTAAEEQGADLVIIDTPPRAENAVLEAAKAAELVLIPCRPSIYDLETIPNTQELLRIAGDTPAAVILNGIPPRGPKRAEAEEAINAMELAVCPVALGSRMAHNHSAILGLSAQEYEPSGKAAAEIHGLYRHIRTLLTTIEKENANGDKENELARSYA